MTNYNDGKWHGFNGTSCPVHRKTIVNIAGRSGVVENVRAGLLYWDVKDFIIAFRVVKEHREPREWWVNVYGHKAAAYRTRAMADKAACSTRLECVHVREVIE